MSEAVYADRKHRDTVSRMLFSGKRTIPELYNALNGTDGSVEDFLEKQARRHLKTNNFFLKKEHRQIKNSVSMSFNMAWIRCFFLKKF